MLAEGSKKDGEKNRKKGFQRQRGSEADTNDSANFLGGGGSEIKGI